MMSADLKASTKTFCVNFGIVFDDHINSFMKIRRITKNLGPQ